MKVHNDNESFRPKTVTFETKDEWRVFLAILGNTRMMAEAIVELESKTVRGLGIVEVDSVLDGMMTASDWSKFAEEL